MWILSAILRKPRSSRISLEKIKKPEKFFSILGVSQWVVSAGGESRPPTHQSLPEILGDDWFRNLQPNADWAKRHGLLILKENSLAGTCQKPILIIFENSRLIGPVNDLHSYLIYKINTKLTHHIQFSELRLKFLTYFL